MTLSNAAAISLIQIESPDKLQHLASVTDALNRVYAAITDPSNVTTEQLESDLSAVWSFYGTTDFETLVINLYGIRDALADRDFDIAFNSAFQMMFHFESALEETPLQEQKQQVLEWIPYFWDSWQQVERELTRLKSNREGV